RNAQTGTRRIEFHVARRRQQVRFVHHEGGEPPLPKMTTPPLAEVHPPCVAPMRLANRPPQTVLRVRHRDQLRMIRHQAISPDFHATLLAPMTHQLQIGGVILLAKERRLPTVPALGNMMRHPGNNDTCQSSHAVNLAEQFAPVKCYVCCPPNSHNSHRRDEGSTKATVPRGPPGSRARRSVRRSGQPGKNSPPSPPENTGSAPGRDGH